MLLQLILTHSGCYANSPYQNPESDSHWLNCVMSPITEPITAGGDPERSGWLGPGSCACLQTRGRGSQPHSDWWITGYGHRLLKKNEVLVNYIYTSNHYVIHLNLI